MTRKPLLLLIDDEIAILETLKDALEDEHYHVEILPKGHNALETVGKLVPDLILLDIFMPQVNGIDLLEQIKNEYPQQKVMMISGYGNIPIALDAIGKGAMDFIEKPLNLNEVLSKISFLKETKKTKTQDTKLTYEQHGIAGKSFLFQELIRQVEQVAPLNLPLLIYGEHGSGKSLLARYAHSKSPLHNEEFIALDCHQEEALPTFESILSKTGTVYFKNINNASLAYQKNILAFFKAAENNPTLRIIASSTQSLFAMMQQGSFNSLLFHKLNTIPLEVPSINKRRYDIPLLVDHFLQQENEKQGKQVVLSAATLRILRNHTWHNNVAGIKIFVEKIVSITPHEHHVITPEELQKHVGDLQSTMIPEQQFSTYNSFDEAKKDFEKEFLLFHLKKNRFDLEQVSDILNVNMPQLKEKMLELNIELKG